MILSIIAYTWIFYGLFLIYCTLRRAKLNGKLAATPLIVRAFAYSYLIPGLLMDWFFNATVGAVVFCESPWKYGAFSLLTARCSEHMDELGWRGDLARWVCLGWLNPFEDNHCH